MSHVGKQKHTLTIESKQVLRSNVFDRLGGSRKNQSKWQDGKSGKSRKSGEQVKSEHDLVMKKEKMPLQEHSHGRMSKKPEQEGWVDKSSSRWSKEEKRDVLGSSDKKSHHYPSDSAHRHGEGSDRRKDAARSSPDHSRGHKRKRRSNSSSSNASSISPPPQKSSKRQRHQSPSPETVRRYSADKGYERGRSREKDSKKVHKVIKVEKPAATKTKHSRPDSPQRQSQHSSEGRLKKQRPEEEKSKRRHQGQALGPKKSSHPKEASYAEDDFSKNGRKTKSSAHPDESEASMRDNRGKGEEKFSKKHKQQKKEKAVYSSEENIESHGKVKKHKRVAGAEVKSKKKSRGDDRRDTMSSSSHYELSSSEKDARESKKKAKEVAHPSSAPRRSSSISPEPRKKYKEHEKYTSEPESDHAEMKRKIKVKKKKKQKNIEDHAATSHKKIKEEIILEELEESPRSKKTKKRKRAREQALPESSESDEKLVKKPRHADRSDVEWKTLDDTDKPRKRAKRDYSPNDDRIARDVRSQERRRSPTPPPPPPLEKAMPRHHHHHQHQQLERRPESPESSSSRNESRHSKRSLPRPSAPLIKRTPESSMEREHFKPASHSSRERQRRGGEEAPYKPVVYRVDPDRDDERRMPPDIRHERHMDKYGHEDRGRRPCEDYPPRFPEKRPDRRSDERRPYYPEGKDRRFEHEAPPRHEPHAAQRFDEKPSARRVDRYPPDDRRRPEERDFPPRERAPSLERRIDHHVIRRDHAKPDWKPPRVEHHSGRPAEYREVVDVRPSPERGRRRSPRLPLPPPSEYDDRRHTQRISSWVDGRDGGKLRIETRERNFSKERWPSDERRAGPVEERVPDVRYKGSKRSHSRDRSHFSDDRGSPASFGTYREVRRSNPHHPRSHDLGLEVTIRDDGNRTSVDYEKVNRKPRTSPARLVSSYESMRSRERAPPPPVAKIRRERSDSESRRPEIIKPQHPRERPENDARYHSRAKESLVPRDASADKPRPRERPAKAHEAKPRNSSGYRTETAKLPNREKARPAADRERSRNSSASRSSTRSPGRQRRHSPSRRGADKHEKKPSKSGRNDKSDRDSHRPSDRQKASAEKKPTPTKSSKAKKEVETKAADVLDVDWTEISSGDQSKTKAKTAETSSSVLEKFSPGNVLLRMGISSNLLPKHVLDQVVAKCRETNGDSPVLHRGLGALNQREAMRRASRMNVFASSKSGVTSRLTSYADASIRQQILGRDGDSRFPLVPPQIINARTYSASIKHYLNKTKSAIEVQ